MPVPEALFRDAFLHPGERACDGRQRRLKARIRRLRSSTTIPDLGSKTYFAATGPRARPHKPHLKGKQEAEYLRWLGLQPAASRTFMLNVRAYGSRLVMLAGKGCHQGKEK
jgi:hypothetical protein